MLTMLEGVNDINDSVSCWSQSTAGVRNLRQCTLQHGNNKREPT